MRHETEPILCSRFVADVKSTDTTEAALAFVARVRAELPGASHHCWAFRLPPAGSEYRYSDDGEPRGSAGAPILKRIEGAGLIGVAVVVSRWFGGTKLGVGGLMRAYGGAAAAALAAAGVREVTPTVLWSVRYPYAADGRVRALLSTAPWELVTAEYDAEVELRLRVPEGEERTLATRLADATAGRARLELGGA